MKRKRIDWARVPWTPFAEAVFDPSELDVLGKPGVIYRNSRYQVSVFEDTHPTLGRITHLSIKTLDKQAYHDWRDLQRIKNELVGADVDAVEIYPAESKLVDNANQYHLWCFLDTHLPFGFQTRLVTEGAWRNSKQRPFDRDMRPADCLDDAAIEAMVQQKLRERSTHDTPMETTDDQKDER